MIRRAGIPDFWLSRGVLAKCLLPASYLYRGASSLRRSLYRAGRFASDRLGVPVIVVGNIFVGGTGKTPLVIWIAELLKQRGCKPGIITRGYRGRAPEWPQVVRADSDPDQVGDEAVLLAQRAACPVAAGPDRIASGRLLVDRFACDLLISDDGLQHYRLGRDYEIVVVDATRGLGNGYCLPAGPLREPPDRLASADLVIANGAPTPWTNAYFDLRACGLFSLSHAGKEPLDRLRGRRIHAVAGIGNPERFFSLLRNHGARIIEHAFPDHYRFRERDLRFGDGLDVIMTEKDAVKCRRVANEHLWYVPVEARLSPEAERALTSGLRSVRTDLRATG